MSDAPKITKTPAKTQEDYLLERLQAFYGSNPAAVEELLWLKRPAGADESPRVSLRVLDWLVTNFAKRHRITYEVDSQPISLFEAYKDELRSFSKRLFDPFCREDTEADANPDRRSRIISFKPSEAAEAVQTTCGQLNFIRWCIENRVLDYARTHLAQIQAHMNQCIGSRRRERERAREDGGDHPKRSMITKGPTGAAKIQQIPTVLGFE